MVSIVSISRSASCQYHGQYHVNIMVSIMSISSPRMSVILQITLCVIFQIHSHRSVPSTCGEQKICTAINCCALLVYSPNNSFLRLGVRYCPLVSYPFESPGRKRAFTTIVIGNWQVRCDWRGVNSQRKFWYSRSCTHSGPLARTECRPCEARGKVDIFDSRHVFCQDFQRDMKLKDNIWLQVLGINYWVSTQLARSS